MCEPPSSLVAAFDALEPSGWVSFTQWVEQQAGGVDELRGFLEPELRKVCGEYLGERHAGVSTIQQARCAKELVAWGTTPPPPQSIPVTAWGSTPPAAHSIPVNIPRNEMRNRKKVQEGVENTAVEVDISDARREAENRRRARWNFWFAVAQTICTVVIFVVLHRLARVYILTPAFHDTAKEMTREEIMEKARQAGY
eukprot:Hpha_TRINITY_DN11689_c0_g1::TRINITY_DN11689_c0_g1_i1::g.49413::m.49413